MNTHQLALFVILIHRNLTLSLAEYMGNHYSQVFIFSIQLILIHSFSFSNIQVCMASENVPN